MPSGKKKKQAGPRGLNQSILLASLLSLKPEKKKDISDSVLKSKQNIGDTGRKLKQKRLNLSNAYDSPPFIVQPNFEPGNL